MNGRICACVLGLAWLAQLVSPGAEPAVPVPAVALAFSPDGTRVLVGADREVRVCRVADGKVDGRFRSPFRKIGAFAFSADARTLAISGGAPGVGGGVHWVEWPGGAGTASRSNHADQATAVAFNPAGSMVASAGMDGIVEVFQWPDQRAAYRLIGHAGPVLAAVFSPDNALLVTASSDRSIKVWDATSGQLRRSFSHHTDIVHCLAVRPRPAAAGGPLRVPQGGAWECASGSQDKTVRVWQPAIGRMVRIVRAHAGAIFAVAYSPDGARLYSAGQEGIVRVIDGDSDQILQQWRAHDDWIYALALNASGAMLATGDWKGNVKLWELREPEPKLVREWP